MTFVFYIGQTKLKLKLDKTKGKWLQRKNIIYKLLSNILEVPLSNLILERLIRKIMINQLANFGNHF